MTTTVPGRISERDFQNNVVELAHLYGWRVAHFGIGQTQKGYRTPVRYDGKGFPDLVLAHPAFGVVFAEMKSDRGRVSDEQADWLALLAEAHGPHRVGVWRPRHLALIARVLADGPATVNLDEWEG